MPACGVSLQMERQYLQRTFPRASTLMGPIEEDLRETLFPTLFGVEDINTYFRKILGHSIKYGGLSIPDP